MRISDWSSDVCSSDLQPRRLPPARDRAAEIVPHAAFHQQGAETGALRFGDLPLAAAFGPGQAELPIPDSVVVLGPGDIDAPRIGRQRALLDRKSTRLNSSH